MTRMTTYWRSGIWNWLMEDLGLFWTIFFIGFLAGALFTILMLFIVMNLFVPAVIKATAIGALT